MFKYPQHMARETRGEMEPTDLKLFTGEVTCLNGSEGLLYESLYHWL